MAAWLDSIMNISSIWPGQSAASESDSAGSGNSGQIAESANDNEVIVDKSSPASGNANNKSLPAPPAVPGGTRQAAARRAAARGHYLEPVPDLYGKLQQDAVKLEADLTAFGFNKEEYRKGLAEFSRLFTRLIKIAEQEQRLVPLSPADLNLLGSIDLLLDKIDVPLPTVLSLQGSQGKGMINLALGHPGCLYVVLHNKSTQEWTLARGATYSFYEFGGAPVSKSAWEAKLNKGQMTPVYWTEKYAVIQEPLPKTMQKLPAKPQ